MEGKILEADLKEFQFFNQDEISMQLFSVGLLTAFTASGGF